MSEGFFAYYHRAINDDVFYNITDYVVTHVSGTEKINDLPGNFTFTLHLPKDGDGDYMDFNVGDEFVICRDDTRTEIIIAGFVASPGRQMVAWNFRDDQPFFNFNIICVQSDFSKDDLISDNFTQMDIDDIFLYIFDNFSNGTLGGEGTPKYVSYVDNFNLDSWKPEGLTLREALTQLTIQIRAYWVKHYNCYPDDTAVLKYYSFIEIHPDSGAGPVENSSWVPGIIDSIIKKGKIPNPIIKNRGTLAEIPAENTPEVTEDFSVIQNWIDLKCNIYASDDNTTLTRWEEDANRNQFEYDLKKIALSVSNVLITEVAERFVLTGSSASTVKVDTKVAGGIEAGDVVIFPARSKTTTYTIATVTEIDENVTNFTFLPSLPFTPTTGEQIEICENVTIYDDNQDSEESNGVVVDIDLDRPARIRFLQFSEPPPGMRIIVLYIKIQPYVARAKNLDSIQNEAIGVKRKEINLDNDIAMTRTEADNLANYFLITEPQKDFKIESRRYEKPPLGLILPINITNWVQENFILHMIAWRYLGARDRQNQPALKMTLYFKNLVKSHEQLMKAFNKPRRTTKTAEVKDYKSQPEKISISENITIEKSTASSVELLLFTSDYNDTKQNIFLMDITANKVYQLTDGANAAGIDFSEPSLYYDGSTIIAGGNASGVFNIYKISVNTSDLSPTGSIVTALTTTGSVRSACASKLNNKIYFVQDSGTAAIYYVEGLGVDAARTKLTGTEPPYWGNSAPALSNDETILYWETDWTSGTGVIMFELRAYRFLDSATYTVLYGNTASANAAVYKVSEHPSNGKLIMSNDMTSGDSIHDGWVNGELSSIDADTVGAYACDLKLAKGSYRKIMPAFNLSGNKIVFSQKNGLYYDLMICDYDADTDTISNVSVLLANSSINYFSFFINLAL